MNILFSESISAKRKRVMIRELVQGQEAAKQLKLLLQKPFGAEGSLSVEELVANVLRSFTESLSVLLTSSSDDDDEPLRGDEVAHRDLLSSGENGSPVVAPGNDIPRSEDSSKSRKRSMAVKKDRRGCYKRRKTAQTWTTVSRTTDDNHAWRKYGQKEILNSKFPRNYFRCSRKHDEGCPATKQVQRTQQNPDMYQITYIGIHTCKVTPKAPHLVTDTSTTWESYIVNSQSDDLKVPNKEDNPISLPSLNTTIKQEYYTPSGVTDHKLDPSQWLYSKDFEPPKPAIIMPLKMASDHNADAVHSCTGSQSLDIDFGVDSVHFRTDFHFDGNQLL